MKEEKKKSDQELLDVDEQGNYIENKKDEEKKKTSNAYKYCLICIGLIALLCLAYFCFFKTKNNKTIYDETKLKNL